MAIVEDKLSYISNLIQVNLKYRHELDPAHQSGKEFGFQILTGSVILGI